MTNVAKYKYLKETPREKSLVLLVIFLYSEKTFYNLRIFGNEKKSLFIKLALLTEN